MNPLPRRIAIGLVWAAGLLALYIGAFFLIRATDGGWVNRYGLTKGAYVYGFWPLRFLVAEREADEPLFRLKGRFLATVVTRVNDNGHCQLNFPPPPPDPNKRYPRVPEGKLIAAGGSASGMFAIFPVSLVPRLRQVKPREQIYVIWHPQLRRTRGTPGEDYIDKYLYDIELIEPPSSSPPSP